MSSALHITGPRRSHRDAAARYGEAWAPGYVYYDHHAASGDCYVWLVRAGALQLSTFCEKLQHLGSELGAAAALSVLRQAVSTANGLLDDLDLYTHGTVMAAISHVERTAPCVRAQNGPRQGVRSAQHRLERILGS